MHRDAAKRNTRINLNKVIVSYGKEDISPTPKKVEIGSTIKEEIVDETSKSSIKELVNVGNRNEKKSTVDHSKLFDYRAEEVKPNTYNPDYQPKILNKLVDYIAADSTLPKDVIISTIVSTLIGKFSSFRIGTYVPGEKKNILSNIYMVSFALSGKGKDKDKKKLNSLLKPIDLEIDSLITWAIEQYHKDIDRCIQQTDPSNKDRIDQLKSLKYISHKSGFITESTNEGLMENFKTFMKLGVGSISWEASEFGDILVSKKEQTLTMEMVKNLYDSDYVYNKQIKGGMSEPISGVPFNILSHSSPEGLFEGESREIIAEKMARGGLRRFDIILPLKNEYPVFEQNRGNDEMILQLLNSKETQENLIIESISKKLLSSIDELKQVLMNNVLDEYKKIKNEKVPGLKYTTLSIGKIFDWDDEAKVYFYRYDQYIKDRSINSNMVEISSLPYKVIKMVPLYCILNGDDRITMRSLKQAIYMVHYFNSHYGNKAKASIDFNTDTGYVNKCYEFLLSHPSQFFTKTQICAVLTTRPERINKKRLFDEALSMIDDNPYYKIDLSPQKLMTGKTILMYGIFPVSDEEENLNIEGEDEN